MKLLIDMNLSPDVTPDHLGRLVISALHQFEKHLHDGALVTIDQKRLRARILPMEAK